MRLRGKAEPGEAEQALAAATSEKTQADAQLASAKRGTIDRMWSWVWIVAVYLLSISLFRWLGGIGAAADAIQRWGHAVGERRRRPISSSG